MILKNDQSAENDTLLDIVKVFTKAHQQLFCFDRQNVFSDFPSK